MQAKPCIDTYHHASADIVYVTGNIPGPGIDREDFESEFSIGCSCREGQCSSECLCTRGVVNYVNDVKVETKLGPIMECNPRCSCDLNCGNRLVQKGPRDCLEVAEAPGKGLGLFTNKPIMKGQFICEYAGEVIDANEARKRFERNKHKQLKNYVLAVVEFIDKNKITTCVDPTQFGNIGRYCNHSCTPNAEIVPVRVERLTPRLCLFAIRNIEPFEEITFHYAAGVSHSADYFSETPCTCGSSECQGYLPHHPF